MTPNQNLQERVGTWASEARPNATAHTLQRGLAERLAQPEAIERHHLGEIGLMIYELAEHLGVNLDHEMQTVQLHRESAP